ncbi:MAG: TadE family protein [Pseudomonadota bacterium]
MSKVIHILRHIRLGNQGSAAIEFAFIVPIFLLLVFGLYEVGYFFFAKNVLERSVRNAARQGITGYVPCGMSRQAFITQIIDQAMLGFSGVENREVTQKVYPSFDTVGEGEPFEDDNGDGKRNGGEEFTDVNGNGLYDEDLGEAGLGGPGDIVLYSAEYEVDTIVSFANGILGGNDTITLVASVAVRNEDSVEDVGIIPCNGGGGDDDDDDDDDDDG